MPTILRIFVAVVVVACCSAPPKVAKGSQNDPTLGGCVVCEVRGPDGVCTVCKLSAHPAVVQPLAAIDLKSGKLLYGLQAVTPGLCYGLTYAPSEWYASGVNFCLNAGKTEGGNVVFPSGIAQLARWGVIGMGGMCSENNSSDGKSVICHALLMFGANIPIE